MSRLIERLRGGLPDEALVTDPDVTAGYAHDHASFCPAGTPAVVVLPRTVEQVRHVMRTATELRVPVVPQGGRSGLSGAANATDGCIVLSLVKMDRILEIDPVERTAVVEPGVINAVLSRAVAERGLYYPPDPSSWEMCTIGGNIGTGAGGCAASSTASPPSTSSAWTSSSPTAACSAPGAPPPRASPATT